ncbi:GNAT family N-acetyltransferase [Billgrantia antri]|uniref:GNAT family N-acetyltransferase n=1 Tax=Billgrantia antri TaxID=2846777 RepID=UPI003B2203E2
MVDFKMIKVSSERLEEFISSWEEAFSRRLNKELYRWLFVGNNIIYAALVKDEIAAGYCLFPLDAIVDGERKVALLCNNVFVSPRFQGHHLFVKLGRRALQDAGSNAYGDIALGIPNTLALPGHRRVGWGVQPPIKFLEKNTSWSCEEIEGNWVKGGVSGTLRAKLEACSRRASQNRAFSILKTAEFIRWRFESKPGVQYWFGYIEEGKEVSAYCICKYYDPTLTLHFVDVDGWDDMAVEKLILQAEKIPENFRRLNVWESTAKCDVFRQVGYKNSTDQNNFILIDPKTMQAANPKGKINLTLADNDVY